MERVPRTKQPESIILEQSGVPITIEQQAHLAELDANIAVWIADIDKANERQREFKEYVSRTHDYKNYYSR